MGRGCIIKEVKYRWKTTVNHVGSTGKHWKLSEETKKKQSECKRGLIVSKETRLKLSVANKGKKKSQPVSEETRKKLSIAIKKFYANGGTTRSGMLGKKASPETIQKLIDSHKGVPTGRTGDKCYFWKGGVTPEHKAIRTSLGYRTWRLKVFENNEFQCVVCKDKDSGNLRAHHLEGFSNNPELRLDTNNGVTLCETCHKEFHKLYGIINVNAKQFEDFLDIRHDHNFTRNRWSQSEFRDKLTCTNWQESTIDALSNGEWAGKL